MTLLEISPIPADDGGTIGRDPRKLGPEVFAEAGVPIMLAADAIRAKCLDCCGNVISEVRKCVSVSCPLWPFRMSGRLPAALKKSVKATSNYKGEDDE